MRWWPRLKFQGKAARGGALLWLAAALPLAAQEPAPPLNPADLPPAARGTMDFNRDIQPILETSCLRCHGPVKPRSDFRLDVRVSALKGGDHGTDIIPGASTNSPLLYYVAGLVDGMDMPPSGKGEPLTAAQIGQLRAWIDQGASYGTNAASPQSSVTLSPTFGGVAVQGSVAKFRELTGEPAGLNGGLSDFRATGQSSPDTRYNISGHATQDDYRLEMDFDQNDAGYLHSGWEQWRKWYSDTGGYFPAEAPAAPDLGRDLYLDYGKAWLDLGLTLPRWPTLVLGYEYDYKQGLEGTINWNASSFTAERAIVPSAEHLDDDTHVLKFSLTDDIGGVAIQDQFRAEFYNLDRRYVNLDERGNSNTLENAHETSSYFQGVNALRAEKRFNDWAYVSAGWLYSKLTSDDSFSDNVNNLPSLLDTVPSLTLERDSEVFNLNALLGPWEGMTLSASAQPEWTSQHALGGANAFLNPVYTNGNSTEPPTIAVVPSDLFADYDEKSITENALLRYTTIPFTALFVEARLKQDSISQLDYDMQPSTLYQEDTGYSSQSSDIRAGFNTAPWRMVSLDAHYRRSEDLSHFQNNQNYLPSGYPGFIRARDLKTDEVEAKLNWRPLSWLRAYFSYDYQTSVSWVETDPVPRGGSPGGGFFAGESYAQLYSLNTTLTPWRRFFLSTTFTYEPSTSVSTVNVPAVSVYKGDVASILLSANYVLAKNLDWFVNYSFSEADYSQNNFAAGLPLGLEYRDHALQTGLSRQFGPNVSAQLKYGYYNYSEPTSGGANDFTANSVFATMTFKWQ